MARVQSVDAKAVFSLFVMPMLITLNGWSQSLLLIDMGVILFVFIISQVVSSWCAAQLTLLVIDSILWLQMPLTKFMTFWSLVLHSALQPNDSNQTLHSSTMSEMQSFKASYQLERCPQCSQEIYMEDHFDVSWFVTCVRKSHWWGHW